MKYNTLKALGLLTTTLSSTAAFASSRCNVEKFQYLLNKNGTYNSEAKTYFDTTAKANSMYAKKAHLEFLAKKIGAVGCNLDSFDWVHILESVYKAQGFSTAVFDGSDDYRSYITKVPEAYDAVNASVVLGAAIKTYEDVCEGYADQKSACLMQALSPKDYQTIQKQKEVQFDEKLGDAVEAAYRMIKLNKTNNEVWGTAFKMLNDNPKAYTAMFWALLLQKNNSFFENETINMLSIYGSDPATHFAWIVK